MHYNKSLIMYETLQNWFIFTYMITKQLNSVIQKILTME